MFYCLTALLLNIFSNALPRPFHAPFQPIGLGRRMERACWQGIDEIYRLLHNLLIQLAAYQLS